MTQPVQAARRLLFTAHTVMHHAICQTTAVYTHSNANPCFGTCSKAPIKCCGLSHHATPRSAPAKKSHYAVTEVAARPWKQSARWQERMKRYKLGHSSVKLVLTLVLCLIVLEWLLYRGHGFLATKDAHELSPITLARIFFALSIQIETAILEFCLFMVVDSYIIQEWLSMSTSVLQSVSLQCVSNSTSATTCLPLHLEKSAPPSLCLDYQESCLSTTQSSTARNGWKIRTFVLGEPAAGHSGCWVR